MSLLLTIVQCLSGIFLVAGVLLHSPKGEGLGGIGGQARLFSSGSRGLEAGLDRFALGCLAVFMISALLHLVVA
jgi:preprotein translocase subunit SecG